MRLYVDYIGYLCGMPFSLGIIESPEIRYWTSPASLAHRQSFDDQVIGVSIDGQPIDPPRHLAFRS